MKEETELARSYANIRINMWSDEDWRNISGAAKLLYITLLCHDTLNYAGVADWRPGKFAPLIDPNWTAEDVRNAAAELERAFFVVISEESEEILIRSFLKHDGLMKQPKMAQAMTTAFASIASLELRQVLAFEVQKLRNNNPDMPCWGNDGIEAVLRHSAFDVQGTATADTSAETPAVALVATPPAGPGAAPTTELDAPFPDDGPKLRSTALPKDWAPTASHFELARSRNVDIQAEAEAFRLHAETHDRRAARWNAAFTTWLKKAKPSAGKVRNDDWMFRGRDS
ncbi:MULTISPECIES: hypothetical protein [unclassified Leucobacter]|uniref:hypothetical protein n=1 Tax=unclassified Leucobacter TaxID=2621730 RepID=UPI0006223C02|nr:hypothetical protein [Leucobacter sp. Ag1]KKI20572.1 hypothetical protein XM48_07610 [Leucobacter sp. Ag1]